MCIRDRVTDHHAIIPTVQLENQDLAELPESEQKNEVLVLRQTQFVVFAVAVVSILTAVFLYLYSKKKRKC